MPDYTRLPIGEKAPHRVNAVIEIPKDSVNKYEYDGTLGLFRLDRALYSPMHYPGDYGFLPRTLGDDGDPLDVLVLVDTPSFSGCLQEVRPIGVLNMVDGGEGDEKILAVGCANPRYFDITNYDQIHPHKLREISHFFQTYKDLEGKRVEINGWGDAKKAHEVINQAIEAYKTKK